MLQQLLPPSILTLSDNEVHSLIAESRQKLGSKILILGHHYQRDEVICHADFTGDSLKLARRATELRDVQFIIFCGVHFMAETSVIMKLPHQEISLPDLDAGCDMADMAETYDVQAAWADARAVVGACPIVPVTYINSKASLKAFVGEHGGVTCTSSNAAKVVGWALEHGQHLFFFPDQHLGRNICKKLGLSPEHDMLIWDPKLPLGGHSADKIKSTKVWLWKGHCPVHALFTVKQIHQIRAQDPNVQIIVHPECSMEVADLADAIGSTEQLIDMVVQSRSGSSFAIGTEKNLVERLAKNNPTKKIISLNPYTCLCGTMNRITARHLAWVLNGLIENNDLYNRITVQDTTAKLARLALQRMFDLS